MILHSSGRAGAEVSLQRAVVGSAREQGPRTGCAVVAEATLKACSALVSHLEGGAAEASRVGRRRTGGHRASAVGGGAGISSAAALLRNGPADAAVGATLDAVNRVLTYSE